MIKLNKLTFNNINSFTEEQTIDFSSKGRLVRIAGLSGAGKSTIFQTIMYVFKICSKSATILQSRHTKKGMYASIEVDVDGEEVVISRSKKDGLSIEFKKDSDKNVSGNSSVAEEMLDRIIGMPRDMFKKIILKKQKDSGFFLKMSNKDMFKFVSDILDVSDENKKIESITKNITDLKNELKFKEDRISEITKDVELAKQKKLEIEVNSPVYEVIKDDLGQLEIRKKDIEKDISELNTKKSEELNGLTKPTLIDVSFDNSSLKKAETELSSKKEEYNLVFGKINSAIDSLSDKKQEAQKELDFLEGQYKDETIRVAASFKAKSDFLLKLKESECPTCFQQWTGDDLNEKINKTENEIKEIKEDILKRKERLATVGELKERLVLIKSKGVDLGNKYEETVSLYTPVLDILTKKVSEEEFKLKNQEDSVKQENITINNKHENTLLEIKNKYIESERTLRVKLNNATAAIYSVNTIKQSNEHKKGQYESNISNCNDNLKTLQNKLDVLKKEEKSIGKQFLVATESKRALKGFILSIFTDFLDSIGERASEILSSIPNSVNTHIMFDGCKESKSGVMKDEITPIITYGSDVGIPIKSLSGGEETSAELAIDLAVIQIIEETKNLGADFFILDEPFNGLGEADKEVYMETIANMDSKKRIIIVDHSTELNEMIDDTIKVKKEHSYSSIEV